MGWGFEFVTQGLGLGLVVSIAPPPYPGAAAARLQRGKRKLPCLNGD